MKFELIEFACTDQDSPKKIVLTDKQYDNYVNGEPQEGYAVFKYLGEVELTQEVIKEVWNAEEDRIAEFMSDDPLEEYRVEYADYEVKA